MKKLWLFVLSTALLLAVCACGRKTNVPPDSTRPAVGNSIEERYTEIMNDPALSNVERAIGISSLALEWDREAERYYKEIWDVFDADIDGCELWADSCREDAKQALQDYWESRLRSDQLKLELQESLIVNVYTSGSIGSIEIARFQYESSKQRALDFESMALYLDRWGGI